jgi:hypothetical protein
MGILTFLIPNEKHPKWSIVAHSLSVEIVKGHVTAKRNRNCDEVRRISSRRWHRNCIGTVIVGFIKDSVVIDNEGKGKV